MQKWPSHLYHISQLLEGLPSVLFPARFSASTPTAATNNLQSLILQLRVAGNCCSPNGTHISYVYVWPFPHGQGCNFLERIVNISFPTELCQLTIVPKVWATSILNLCWKYRSGCVVWKVNPFAPAAGCKGRVMALGPCGKEAQESECKQASPSCIFLLITGCPGQVSCLPVSGLGFLFSMLPRKEISTACPHPTWQTGHLKAEEGVMWLWDVLEGLFALSGIQSSGRQIWRGFLAPCPQACCQL